MLRRNLATTNPIESCSVHGATGGAQRKRWREGDLPLRWTATGLLEAENSDASRLSEILLLEEPLNPSRIQQKEVRTVEVA